MAFHRALAPILALAVLLMASRSRAAPPAAPPDLGTVSAALVGTWQSTDDTKFTREFDAGGNSRDFYEGDQSGSNSGRWSLFLGNAPPPELKSRKFVADGVYLKLDQNGDELVYVLVGLTRADLRMIYLESGNTISFVRLK